MNSNRNFKRLIAILMIVCTIALMIPMQAIAATGVQWTVSGSTGIYWVKTADSKSSDAALEAQVQLFSQELQAKGVTSTTLPIEYGPMSSAGADDIILYLDSTLTIGEQAYSVAVGQNSVVISASDADGLFYGCRYVLQHLITGDGLTKGSTYADAPDVLERGVSLDCGRKYFTADWVKELIREMSWSNLNALTLHFSEEMGLRFVLDEYKWLGGADNSLCPQNGSSYTCNTDTTSYWTETDMKEIISYAKLYHVEIIPSFDTPGHMTYIVEKYNEKYGADIGSKVTYNDEVIYTDDNSAKTSRGIDISNEEARLFTMEMVKAYAQFFYTQGCRKFDMGGDELMATRYLTSDDTTYVVSWTEGLPSWAAYAQERTGNAAATAYDAFIIYMNDMASMLKELGYQSVRMWNDTTYLTYRVSSSGAVTLDKDIEITYWKKNTNNGLNTVYTYLDNGHNVLNYYNDFNYYVTRFGGFYPCCTYELIYDLWGPYVFKASYDTTTTGYVNQAVADGYELTDSTQKEKVKGTAFCIWCDQPDYNTEDQIMADLDDILMANGAKSWDGDKDETTSFEQYSTFVTAIGDCPSTLVAAPDVTILVDTTELQSAVAAYDADEINAYTPATFNAYTEAVENAQTVLNSTDATQEQVDAALAAVVAAQEALVKRADMTALQAAVDAYNEADSAYYTSDSFAAYKEAVEAGQTVLANADATQDEVDAASASIHTAKAALVAQEGTCVIVDAGFRTTRVRSGGTAVLQVITSAETTDFAVTDAAGNAVADFDVIQIPGKEKTDDGYCYYLKYAVTGTGAKTYTVCVNGELYKTASLTLWQPAN